MIAFRIASQYGDYYLDVPSDISVSLTVNNAFFDPESVQRTYTFDFVLPRSARTDTQLHHIYRIDSNRDTGIFEVEMLLQGLPYEQGTLTVSNVETGYNLQFANKERVVLTDLDANLSTFFTTPISLLPLNFDAKWRYRIQLFNFQSNTGDLVSVSINGQSFGEVVQGSIANPPNWGNALKKVGDRIAATFIDFIVDSNIGSIDISSDNQIQIIANAHTEIIVVNSHTPQETHRFVTQRIQELSDDPSSDVVFPTFTAPNFYANDIPPHYSMRIVNECDEYSAQFFTNEPTLEKQAFKNTIVPMLRLTYVLNKIGEKLGLIVGGDWFNLPTTRKLIFFNAVSIDNIVELGTTPPQYLNQCNTSFLASNHLPDMTAKELLKDICADFGLSMQIESGQLTFSKKALNNKIQHWTSKLVADKLKVEPGLNQGVKLNYDFTEATKFQTVPPNFSPLSIAKGAKEVPLNFNTLLRYFGADHAGLPLETVWFWGKQGDRPKSLLLYYGRNNPLINYPFANSENHDRWGNKLNDYSLALSGDDGRYETHLHGIIEYQNARTVTAIFRLTLDDLQGFQRGDFSRILAFTPRGELKAIIKDLNIKIKNNSLEPATVNLLRE